MTAEQFAEIQEIFVVVFGPIIQWLFVGIVTSVTGLLIMFTGLTLLRRLLGTQLGERPAPEL